MAALGLNRSRQAPAEDTPSFGSIAERFRRAGDLDRAIALCQEGLKKFPNQLSARVTLGWSYLDKGEYDLARQELERVLRRAPDNLAAIRGLAELHDRAEHAVTGMGPDGTWSAPEETHDEPAAAAALVGESAFAKAAAAPERAPQPAHGAEVQPATPATISPSVQTTAMPPVAAAAAASGGADPQALLETPAQAAIAHAGPEAASVFEQVLDVPSAAVEEAEAAVEVAPDEVRDTVEEATPAFEDIEPVQELARPEITALEAAEWDIAAVAAEADAAGADADADAVPVLFSENAEIELAEVASALALSAPDVVSEEVVDLPAADGILEGELAEFEQPVDPSQYAAPEDVNTLIADASAFEVDELATMLPALDLAAPVEAGEDSESERQPDIDLTGSDLALVPEIAVAEPDVDFGMAAASVPQDEDTVIEPMVQAIADAAPSEVVETVEAASEPDAPALAAVDAAEPEAVSEAQSEPELEGEPEAEEVVEPAAIAAFEAVAAEPAVEAVAPVVDAPAFANPPASAPEPVQALPALAASMDHAGLAEPGIDLMKEFGAAAAPDVAWLPPAVAAPDEPPALPVAAAAAVHLAAARSVPAAGEPAVASKPKPSAAPIAALESFLKKVSARRLHLNPGSVA